MWSPWTPQRKERPDAGHAPRERTTDDAAAHAAARGGDAARVAPRHTAAPRPDRDDPTVLWLAPGVWIRRDDL